MSLRLHSSVCSKSTVLTCLGAARIAFCCLHDDSALAFPRLLMKAEPLIQKLFAIERAIGIAAPGVLRAMVIDAQETALRMDLDSLQEIDAIRLRLGANQETDLRASEVPDEESGFPRSA
jgi:hypothetical protein